MDPSFRWGDALNAWRAKVFASGLSGAMATNPKTKAPPGRTAARAYPRIAKAADAAAGA